MSKKRKGKHKKGNGKKKKRHGFMNREKCAFVVANPVTHQDIVKSTNPQSLGHYRASSTVLLVGEGNFTFAASLATQFGGERITATALDSQEDVLTKYGAIGREAIGLLKATSATLHFSFDATNPDSYTKLEVRKHNYIIFNFPHAGGATHEDLIKNQRVLKEFFIAVQSVLHKKKGEVHVTLRDTPFYESWDVTKLAKETGLDLVGKEKFKAKVFSDLGYKEVRTRILELVN